MKLKPEELPELIKYMDLPDDIDSLDKAKEVFEKNFVKRTMAATDPEIVKSITGQRMNSIEGDLFKVGKEIGIEIDEEIKKAARAEDKIAIIGTRFKSLMESKLEEERKKHADPSEAIKGYEEKFNKMKTSLKEKDELLSSSKTQYDELFSTLKNKERDIIINSKLSSVKSNPAIKKDDELKLIGFETKFNQKYITDIDEEKKEVIVRLRENGQQIPSKTKTSTFMTFEDLYIQEADSAGLIIKQGQPARVPVRTNQSNQRNDDPPAPRKRNRPVMMG
jgi:hypothetical protein